MCIVAYVSGHGFGHAAREIEILRHLPPDIDLIVKSASAEWFWRAGMDRPFEFLSENFDVGCIQHDSIEIDIPATYNAWIEIDARNAPRLDEEIAFLKRVGARAVVADIPPLALKAAVGVGIPGICVANFTWADIYSAFLEAEPRFEPIIAQLTRDYAAATLCLDTDLSLPMPYFPRVEPVGLVARPGTSRREMLFTQLPPEAQEKRLALMYLGNWGYPLPYEQLESFTGWHFISLNEPPVPVRNWTVIDTSRHWKHPDLTASVDLVISKPGYGIVAECQSTGTPILYPPRPQFSEYAALETALVAWPGGLQINQQDFFALHWDFYLDRVPDRAAISMLPANGGPMAAHKITEIYRSLTIGAN